MTLLLQGCGESVEKPEMIILGGWVLNPIPDDFDWSQYHKPSLQPKRITGLIYPILIPKQYKKSLQDSVGQEKVQWVSNCANTWDSSTRTLKVFFGLGESQLHADDKKTVELLVAEFRRNNTQFTSIEISGYADRLGSQEANHKLSGKRIENLKQALIDSGVPLKNILVKEMAYGESTSTDLDGSINPNERRVELAIVDTISQSLKGLIPDVVLVDNSDSMGAYLQGIHSYLTQEGGAETAYYGFDGVFGSNTDFEAVNKQYLTQVRGGTPILKSTLALMNYIALTRKGEKTTIVIVSDGMDTSSHRVPSRQVFSELMQHKNFAERGGYKDITVHIVGAHPGFINSPLAAIIRNSGGTIIFAEK